MSYTVEFNDTGVKNFYTNLPLLPRAARPAGQLPELARVPVGHMYIAVAASCTPPLSDSSISGKYFPVEIKRAGKSKVHMFVPVETLRGVKHQANKQKMTVLIKGTAGIPVAPATSAMDVVGSDGGEHIITLFCGAKFTVQLKDGTEHTYMIKDEAIQELSSPALGSVDFDSMIDRWYNCCIDAKVHEDEPDFLDVLIQTLAKLIPHYWKAVQRVLPVEPWGAVCLPLANATHRSEDPSMWHILASYFKGYYEATGINEDLAVGSMPADRLLMRCLYEIAFIASRKEATYPPSYDVRWTINALFDL